MKWEQNTYARFFLPSTVRWVSFHFDEYTTKIDNIRGKQKCRRRGPPRLVSRQRIEFRFKKLDQKCMHSMLPKVVFWQEIELFWWKSEKFLRSINSWIKNFCILRWPIIDYKRRSLPTHRSHWSRKIVPRSSLQVMLILPLLFAHYTHILDLWGDVREDLVARAEACFK